MGTTLDERSFQERSRERELMRPGERSEKGLWAVGWSLAGTAVWAGMAVLARLGIARIGGIELMFLFGPLVIVPLGMELGRIGGFGSGRGRELAAVAQILQPVGAVLAVAAICSAPGLRAGIVAGGWLIVCALSGAAGVVELGSGIWRRRIAGRAVSKLQDAKSASFPDQELSGETRGAPRIVIATRAIALIDLAVGGCWLMASRLGWRPMGIQEPIGLLTAVHFHFAGFATALIAGATLQFAEARWAQSSALLGWLRRVVIAVIVLPFVVAAGFVISAGLRMAAAILFSLSVSTLAGFAWWCSSQTESPEARGMLRLASSAVWAGMLLAGTYAVLNFLGSDWLTIPRMASTHGVVNAVGFCLMGLLGWLVEGGA